jgi:hypothetical protein
MTPEITKTRLALAIAAAVGATAVALTPAAYAKKPLGTYVTGDFHNHSTCSDGSISMQKLVQKSTTNGNDAPWGLDWFVQAGHGGTGNRNCTLVEDAALETPAYPLQVGPTPFDFPTTGTPPNPSPSQHRGPQTTWAQSIGSAGIKGDASGSGATQNMWRWQALQEFQYPVLEYLAALQNKPLFLGVESVVAGHEHTSMAVITGQMPLPIYDRQLPTSPGYTPLGNANALAKWQYCFDRGNSDTSRGNATTQPGNVNTGTGNNWDCSVPGSPNSASTDWNAAAAKLNGANGTLGHIKTVEGVKWMAELHPDGSYYVPAHLERAGPFRANGNNGFNVEHLRNLHNAAPDVAFGMETQPGHGASDSRGEYAILRNGFGTDPADATKTLIVDSVGGTTYGGTGIYGAQVGGVWDALLGEGRNFWFFASSDWHNRGAFGPDDRRTTQDFYPGEYQRDYVLVKNGKRGQPMSPAEIVDGLRSGNSFTDSGQLIDRLAFVACADTFANESVGNALLEAGALVAAALNTGISVGRCATMGEKLVLRPGEDIVVAIVVRDPSGRSYSPYSFANPSLVQIGTTQRLDKPVLDHIDVIGGAVTGYKNPNDAAAYAGEWPRDWILHQDMSKVPAGAKNTTAKVLKTFNSKTWSGADEFKRIVFRIDNVRDSQYLRLRGTNLPPGVPFETDADGDPLTDKWTNAAAISLAANQTSPTASEVAAENANLRIPCTSLGFNEFNGCPAHMGTRANVKYSSYDVAAWADLWFYSNPIYIEVRGSTPVVGVE